VSKSGNSSSALEHFMDNLFWG